MAALVRFPDPPKQYSDDFIRQFQRVLSGYLGATNSALSQVPQFGQPIVPFAATLALSAAQGNTFSVALTGNVTTFSLVPGVLDQNPDAGLVVYVFFQQDATGGRTVAFPTGTGNNQFIWANGVVGSLSTAPNSLDLLTCVYRVNYASTNVGNWYVSLENTIPSGAVPFTTLNVTGNASIGGLINCVNLINPETVGGTIGPFSTVETNMTNGMLIAANSFANGQRFRITVNAYCTTTAVNTNALRVRVGPNNSTADTQISLWNVVTTATGSSVAFKVVFEIQIFGSGASTPVACDGGAIINSSTSGVISSVAALSYNGFQSANINNTVPVYINATYQSAASTSSVLVATSLVEMVR